MQGVAQGLELAAKDRGLTYEIDQANNDPALMAAQVRQFVSASGGALVIAPVDSQSISPAIKAAIWSGAYVGAIVPPPATSITDYKAALASNHWVPFSIPVYNSWYFSNQVRLTGDITNPIPGEIAAGGHAMCIVGCVDQPDRPELGGGRFVLRNSWGGTWGQTSPYGAGYGTIPYIYIQRFAIEAYTLG